MVARILEGGGWKGKKGRMAREGGSRVGKPCSNTILEEKEK